MAVMVVALLCVQLFLSIYPSEAVIPFEGHVFERVTNSSIDITDQLVAAWNKNGNFTALYLIGSSLGMIDDIRTLLNTTGKYTIFPPDDNAIAAVDRSTFDSSKASLFFQSQVVYGYFTYENLVSIGNGSATVPAIYQPFPSASNELVNLANNSLAVEIVDGAVTVGGSPISVPDVFLSNKNVSAQGVNKVIVPATSPPPPASTVSASPPPSPPPKNSGT